ncbi:MAG TPA: hypothetical protein VK177_04140 [Flavobacteriales bacterium]|nr:hypothetical protein [Flavobacteriales bacterium]
MKTILFYIAFTCWLLAILTHTLTIAHIDVENHVPYTWALHVLIFVVWIPLVFDLKKNKELQEYYQSPKAKSLLSGFYFCKIIFKGAPLWMQLLVGASLFYSALNFIVLLQLYPGSAEIQNGHYVLMEKGETIKHITEAEYHYYNAIQLRIFSGHWLIFYGVSTAAFYRYSGLIKQNQP